MRMCCLLLVAASLGVAASPAPPDPNRADAEKLSGAWVVTAVEVAGLRLGEAETAGYGLVFKGGEAKLTIPAGKKVQTLTFAYALEAAARPKTINLNLGKGQGATIQGIYQLDGDQLWLCHGQPGQARPEEFKSEAETGSTLLVLKRAK